MTKQRIFTQALFVSLTVLGTLSLAACTPESLNAVTGLLSNANGPAQGNAQSGSGQANGQTQGNQPAGSASNAAGHGQLTVAANASLAGKLKPADGSYPTAKPTAMASHPPILIPSGDPGPDGLAHGQTQGQIQGQIQGQAMSHSTSMPKPIEPTVETAAEADSNAEARI